MGCCSTEKAIAVRPLINDNLTVHSSKTVVGVLNRNNNFGEDSHVLRQVRSIESPPIYRTDQINLSNEQYELVNSSFLAMSFTLSGLQKIHYASNLRPDLYKVKDEVTREINNQAKWSRIFKKDLEELDKQKIDLSNPLFKDAFNKIELASNFLVNENELKSLIKNLNAVRLFHAHEFDAKTVYSFNVGMLEIALNVVPENLQEITADDKNFLMRMAEIYACKGVIEHQLPKVKQHFAEMQGKLNKEFLAIVGNAIKSTEIGLKNINQSKRAAIFEKISPTLRPTSYGKYTNHVGIFEKHKSVLLYKSDNEIADIFRELKEIPLLLP